MIAIFACLLVVGGGLGWIRANRRTFSWLAQLNQSGQAYAVATQRTAAWVRSRQPGVLGGVVFGDSVLAQPSYAPVFCPALGATLARDGTTVDLLDLTYRGFDAFLYYYALQPILAGHPRFAVVEVNLRTFARDWWAAPGLHATPLAAGLSLRQVLHAREALATQGIGLSAPLSYQLEQATGMLFVFDGLRLAGGRALHTLGTNVNTLLGLNTASSNQRVGRFLRLELDTARAWYGQDFTLAPNAAVLRALRDQLVQAGVLVLFVVAPINLTRVVEAGLDLDDLDVRMQRLRAMIGASADEWIDVSESFSPADFLDTVHTRERALQRLARYVADQLSRRLAGKPLVPNFF